MTDLSIIIVTYNPGDIFGACLESISAGVGDLIYEVIVVDNASQDGVVGQAIPKFPNMQFILNEDNTGFAGGNNQGLAAATGQYLLLLNPDVILEPDSLAALVNYLKSNPTVGIVGPRVRDRADNISLTAHTVYSPLMILWQYLGLDRLFPNHVHGRFRQANYSASTPFEVAWVQGCCLLFRREVYQAIGGLDEGFFLFAEEPDFCERAARAGWTTFFVPDAVVHHIESNSISRYPERKIRNYHISPLYYFRKRGKDLSVRILKIGFTLEFCVKVFVRLVQKYLGQQSIDYVQIYRRVLSEVWRY